MFCIEKKTKIKIKIVRIEYMRCLRHTYFVYIIMNYLRPLSIPITSMLLSSGCLVRKQTGSCTEMFE